MKYTFILIVLFVVNGNFAQTNIKKSSISSGGGSQINGTTQITYTLGEMAIQENEWGTTHLSEGFIGPDLLSTLGISDYNVLTNVSVYPNPVQTNIYIQLPDQNKYQIYLYDIYGKQLTHITGQKIKTWNMSAYKPGVYLLLIVDPKSKRMKQFKIEKY